MPDNWIICAGLTNYNFNDFSTPFQVKISHITVVLCQMPLEGLRQIRVIRSNPCNFFQLKRPGLNKESGPGLSWRRPTLPLYAVPSALSGLSVSRRIGMGKRWNPDVVETWHALSLHMHCRYKYFIILQDVFCGWQLAAGGWLVANSQ